VSTNGSTTPADEQDGDAALASIEMPRGDVVIYAKDDHTCWIQSDTTVDPNELR
jgi:hypothetical protein